ncbi:PLP-dependent aminotransferase family protein [candidate division FCPU426 bacterium]|nr:PLP-dependent aminotransferase family protein [candidate division FCPU426 bacterium]
MTSKLEALLSHSARHMRASEIRELLKLLNTTDMISFAGGLPNPDAFPIGPLKKAVNHVLDEHAREALQYSVTEGHTQLRNAIAAGMGKEYNLSQSAANILITTGSQQALNLLAQVFLDPDDVVLTENPTYLGALLTFRACRARVETVPMDHEGMCIDLAEKKLGELRQQNRLPKFIYTIPNFQNPTGISMSIRRREKLYALLAEYDLLLVEDDPYGMLRFEGERPLLIKNFDQEERVLYLGSFSKILAPGFRVGWIAGRQEILNRLSLAKQAQDLCTNAFGQYCVYEAIHHKMLFPHIAKIVRLYKTKRDLMLQALDRHFPAGVTWNRPAGGMFLWVMLPGNLNALSLLSRAIEQKVAYVPGEPFFPSGGGHNTLRLNFSFAADDQIDVGIARLGRVFKEALAQRAAEDGGDGMEIF